MICPSMCFLAFAFTAPMRKLRLLMKRWKISLLLATPGAKSLGTLAPCFGTLPRRDGKQRATPCRGLLRAPQNRSIPCAHVHCTSVGAERRAPVRTSGQDRPRGGAVFHHAEQLSGMGPGRH